MADTPHDEACFVDSTPKPKLDLLAQLPTELALRILHLLSLITQDQPSHLLNCRLVSSTWNTLLQDNLLWRNAFFSNPNYRLSSTSNNNNWYSLFRDRFILDKRWTQGHQTSHKLKGHSDSVYCLQMHHHQIITGSRDRTIKIWDTTTRECQRTLRGHNGSVLCVRFDQQVLVSGSSDSTVFVWDKANWTVVQELRGHRSGVLDLALSPTAYVSCSKDTTIKVWSRPDGLLLRTITGHQGPVNALDLSTLPLSTLLSHPDSSPSNNNTSLALLSASGDSTMKLWELNTGALIRTFDGHLRGLACLKLVEPTRQVITGSNDETIKIWNLINGQCLRTLLGHSALVRSLDFSIPQNRLVSGSYDKTIKVWDLTTGQLLLDFRKGADRNLVFDVKFNLTTIVSVGHPNSIMLLDFADGLDAHQFI